MKIAFISDIHSNIHALNEVIKEIERENIRKIFCCGDVVGYNAFPSESIKTLKEKKVISVRGNHDNAVITGDTSWFNETGRKGIKYCRDVLPEKEIEFLKSLPSHLDFEMDGIKFYIVHGSPRDKLYEYVFPTSSDHVFLEILKDVDADVIVMGHTHIPMKKSIYGKLLINPGSVGQPRDGDSRASFAVFDTEDREIIFRRVKYNIEEAAQEILNKDLPRFSAERLFLGV